MIDHIILMSIFSIGSNFCYFPEVMSKKVAKKTAPTTFYVVGDHRLHKMAAIAIEELNHKLNKKLKWNKDFLDIFPIYLPLQEIFNKENIKFPKDYFVCGSTTERNEICFQDLSPFGVSDKTIGLAHTRGIEGQVEPEMDVFISPMAYLSLDEDFEDYCWENCTISYTDTMISVIQHEILHNVAMLKHIPDKRNIMYETLDILHAKRLNLSYQQILALECIYGDDIF